MSRAEDTPLPLISRQPNTKLVRTFRRNTPNNEQLQLSLLCCEVNKLIS